MSTKSTKGHGNNTLGRATGAPQSSLYSCFSWTPFPYLGLAATTAANAATLRLRRRRTFRRQVPQILFDERAVFFGVLFRLCLLDGGAFAGGQAGEVRGFGACRVRAFLHGV